MHNCLNMLDSIIYISLYRILPTIQQVESYDNELVWAVRLSDLDKLHDLFSAGKCMCACNRFSESIIHMACRRSSVEIVEYLLSHGGSVDLVDDYGRTPLHDACWRTEPCFEIVALLMDHNIDLIRNADKRGSVPLNYVRQEHWTEWCTFLFNNRDKYWAIRSNSPAPVTMGPETNDDGVFDAALAPSVQHDVNNC